MSYGRLGVAALTLLFAVATAACCRILDDDGGAPQHRRRPVDPKPQPTDVDLGLAAFPAGRANAAAAARFRFVVPPLKPDTYRAAFSLDAAEAGAVRAHFRGYADAVGYQVSGSDRFKWSPPAECKDDLHCVYDSAATRDAPDLKPLAELFRARARAAKLTSLETAEMVVAFVQSIRYEIPKAEPFGLLPPALVASERRGDCDSKALLALVLLHHLGVESVLVESEAHHHAMLGIALPTQGTSFEEGGRRYALTECTAIGWPIGQIAPQLLHPNDWRAVPVRFDATAPGKRGRGRSRRHRR